MTPDRFTPPAQIAIHTRLMVLATRPVHDRLDHHFVCGDAGDGKNSLAGKVRY